MVNSWNETNQKQEEEELSWLLLPEEKALYPSSILTISAASNFGETTDTHKFNGST